MKSAREQQFALLTFHFLHWHENLHTKHNRSGQPPSAHQTETSSPISMQIKHWEYNDIRVYQGGRPSNSQIKRQNASTRPDREDKTSRYRCPVFLFTSFLFQLLYQTISRAVGIKKSGPAGGS